MPRIDTFDPEIRKAINRRSEPRRTARELIWNAMMRTANTDHRALLRRVYHRMAEPGWVIQ
jgi:NADH:ubiquinone oxidoreductase subunit B-like Fe-S oxidoreductase